MTTSSNGQAAAEAIEKMSEEELAAWITAGDYSSVGGVEISEDASQKIADAVGYPEVVGLSFDMGFGMKSNLASTGGSTPPTGHGGHFAVPGQTHNKLNELGFGGVKTTLAGILHAS